MTEGKPRLCSTKKSYESPDYDELWDVIGAPQLVPLYKKYFEDNPYFGKDQVYLKPPPVPRLLNCYGVNLETEKLYFYRKKKDFRGSGIRCKLQRVGSFSCSEKGNRL